MSRNYVIAAGAVAWTGVGLIALGYLLDGNVVIPALMAAVGVPWAGLVAFRRRPLVLRPATARPEVDAAS